MREGIIGKTSSFMKLNQAYELAVHIDSVDGSKFWRLKPDMLFQLICNVLKIGFAIYYHFHRIRLEILKLCNCRRRSTQVFLAFLDHLIYNKRVLSVAWIFKSYGCVSRCRRFTTCVTLLSLSKSVSTLEEMRGPAI